MPAWLELEITERLLLDKSGAARDAIEALRAMGVSIAIDGVGTGYSAPSYLTGIPLDTPKIDRSFVQASTYDPRRAGMIGAAMRKATGTAAR